MQVAEAEKRHQQHWRDMLGEHAGKPSRPSLSSAILQFMAKHFGSVFILAMAQMAESRSPTPKTRTPPKKWRLTRLFTKKSFAP